MTDFIETLAPFAVKHGTAANVLPSLIIAQGILESGSGQSTLATQANNLFGIKKGTNWTGEVYAVVTGEYRKNAEGEDEYYEITAEFRKYPSYEGAVADLCSKYTTMPRYAAVPGQRDFRLAAQAVKDAGYATDPIYPAKLVNIYEQYGLSAYDFTDDVYVPPTDETNEEETNMVFKVAVDAGHGRNTAGKRTPAGEREWTFNDAVVRALIAELNTYANVEILRVDDPTGNTDVPLSTRAQKANAFNADVYVSVHHNANTGNWGTWTGSETFVMEGTTASMKAMALAKAVHPKLVAAMGLKDRGIKAANFAVLRETKMPAILTEGGYMDSTIDILALRSSAKLKAQGQGLATGIAQYGGLKKKAAAVPTPAKPVEQVSNKALFRVRKTWADADTQKGAFSTKEAAIIEAKKYSGYKVFDHLGKIVYPEPVVIVPAPKPTSQDQEKALEQARLKTIAEELKKPHNFVGLIVFHGDADAPGAYLVHKKTGYPMMKKSTATQHTARHIIVIGGGVDGFNTKTDFLTLLSGNSAADTQKAVQQYLAK